VAESAELAGIVVPLLTPTDAADRVDGRAFRQLIDRLIAAGVHGLFVGGSAGSGPLLVDGEWERMAAIAVDATGGRVPLLGGAQDTSTRRAVDKVRRLHCLGYRHIVVTPTYYVATTTADEHLRHFGACREAADGVDLIPYNIPQVTNSVIAVETFVRMAREGWVRHCKESSGDLDYLRRLVAEGGEAGLKVFAGEERNAATALQIGAVGLVPVCANLDPAPYLHLMEAAARRDGAEADRLQEQIRTLVGAVVLGGPCWLSGPMYALGRLGIGDGTAVAPLAHVGAEQAARIDRVLGPAAMADPHRGDRKSEI